MAAKAYQYAHPLLRVKFPALERLPFYNMYRERAALLAAGLISQRPENAGPGSGAFAEAAEQRFSSADGVIVGRPDLIDTAAEEVVDYKTGLSVKERWQVSQREARQLSLYAYLANEAGISVSHGKIVRGDGQTATIDITPTMTEGEADRAREVCPFTGSVVAMPPGGPIRTARTGPAVPSPVSRPCLSLIPAHYRPGSQLRRPAAAGSCPVSRTMSNLLIMSGDMSKDVSGDKNLRRASWP
jgi:hypothetical protein